MLILHSSNKVENLFSHLHQVLSTPLESPFKAEVFLIQSKGMERWLCQQFTAKNTLFAHFNFIFPNLFFSELEKPLTVKSTQIHDLSRAQLSWKIEYCLRTKAVPELSVLDHYLVGQNSELKYYQLAQKLAILFDQYQFMRPDWLSAWQKNKLKTKNPIEVWQAALWRHLFFDGLIVNQGEKYQNTSRILKKSNPYFVQQFCPERLSVFGINTLSPIYLELLYQLSRHIPVHFYLLNPCESYWADLETKKQRAKKAVALLDEQQSNPLLIAFGAQGQDFQSLLLTQTEFDFEYKSFEANESNTLLAQIQNDILLNRYQSNKNIPLDDSLQVHACHSPMREVEVLKDQLLHLLNKDKSLNLRDIVVMAPDISEYAHFINAIFSDIPHALADNTLFEQNKLLQVFLRFLNLTQSRFSWQSCFELLEEPCIYLSFDLVESDLPLIQHWIMQTEIRWGADETHRQDLDLPAFKENSWQAGIERLLMGLAVADSTHFYQDILPFVEIEGQQSQILAGLIQFFQLLNQARQCFSQATDLATWQTRLQYYINLLFATETIEIHDRSQLNQIIMDLADFYPFNNQDFSFEIITTWLKEKADSEKTPQGFLRGQLTFCSLLPMRSIPFKAIAVLGLNEGKFPKVEPTSAFDLMQDKFRKGDRSKLNDERYQFLEIILSSREYLILSYIGQSIKNNQSQAPSLVVSELLDYLHLSYGIEIKKCITKHPLQNTSPRYFDQNNPCLFSYSNLACETAKQRYQTPLTPSNQWWDNKAHISTESTQKQINIIDLVRFFKDPQRWFVEQILQFKPFSLIEKAQEIEVFENDPLKHYLLYQDWLAYYLNTIEPDSEQWYKKIKAQGRWFVGAFGKMKFHQEDHHIRTFAKKIQNLKLGNQLIEHTLNLTIEDIQLVGTLPLSYEKGNLYYRYAKLKGKDLISAWIYHLLDEKTTHICATDEYKTFKPIPTIESKAYLKILIETYLAGQIKPSPLLIEPANVWCKKGMMGARKKYQDNLQYMPHWQALYRSQAVEEVINSTFETHCEQIFTPMFQAYGD